MTPRCLNKFKNLVQQRGVFYSLRTILTGVFFRKFGYIETGALLEPFVALYYSVTVQVGAEVAVSGYFTAGKILLQGAYQCAQGAALPLCTGVCGFSLGIEAAFVTNSDAMSVVVLSMGPNSLNGAGSFYTAIPADVVMVPGAVEASQAVAPLQIALGKGLVGAGAAAVYHYQVNLSHGSAYMRSLQPGALHCSFIDWLRLWLRVMIS